MAKKAKKARSVQRDAFLPDAEDLARKAEEGRDKGIEQSHNTAEKVDPGWSELAYQALTRYVNERVAIGGEFTTEEVRLAVAGELAAPPSDKSWGAVLRRAQSAGKILTEGGRNAVYSGHKHLVAVWKRLR